MKYRVKFLKDTTEYKSGAILEIDATAGDDPEVVAWLADGTCEKVADVEPPKADPKPEPKRAPVAAPAPEFTGFKAAMTEVAAGVKSAFDEIAKIKRFLARERVDVKVDEPEIGKGKAGFKSLGHFCNDVMRHDATNGRDTSEHLKRWSDHCVKVPSGISVEYDPSAGVLVPTEFRATLFEKVFENSSLMSRCQVLPIQRPIEIPYLNETSRADGSRSGGITAYWVAEGNAATSSKPAFGKLRLGLHKLVGLVYDTDEIVRQSPISLEPLLTRLFTQEMTFVMEQKILRGTGAGVPQGILNAPATVSVSKETGQGAATIVTENIDKMFARLWAGARAGSEWFMSQDCWPQILALTRGIGLSGQPMFTPPGAIAGAPAGALYGKPIVELEHSSALGTVGDLMYANFQHYIFATGSNGVEAMSSLHFKFDTAENAMRFLMYGDGQCWWNAALTPYNASSTLSPFVTLATRA